jgi:hypothetical protein
MSDQTLDSLLNSEQKRSLIVALYQLELSLRNISEWLDKSGTDGILYDTRLTVSKDKQLEGQKVIRAGLDSITKFAKLLRFKKYNENLTSTINSVLHAQWINLHNQYAAKQIRSGEVHPELGKHLDPLIDELITKVLKLQEIIQQE